MRKKVYKAIAKMEAKRSLATSKAAKKKFFPKKKKTTTGGGNY